MVVRKLRLQRGWSQDQLAEMTGLSVRTIQRVERGRKPSLETSKALAAVFEVDISTFIAEDTEMNTQQNQSIDTMESDGVARLAADEKAALTYAKGVQEFWTGVLVYVVLLVAFTVAGFRDSTALLVFGGIGLGIALQGLLAYEVIRLPWQDFEKRIAEKRLGRKF